MEIQTSGKNKKKIMCFFYSNYLMKWNIITHNIRGLNDPENIAKERGFLNSLTPKVDIVMIQEHKLRCRALENLGSRFMPGFASWIVEAAPEERS
jgi:hypothetical protein